jgi:photosystem II stability/assembly factor-like uncharacterized protein
LSGNRASRRQFLRGTAGVALSLAGLVAASAHRPALTWAQETSGSEWEPTGLGGDVRMLYTPASGAFFADRDTTADPAARMRTHELLRSDDAGDTWRPVPLPPEGAPITVDPTDHDIIYATSDEGLHKSTDGGQSYPLVLPRKVADPERRSAWGWDTFMAMAISPADPNRLYVATRSYSTRHYFWSYDGGATWDTPGADYPNSPSYACVVTFLLPAETDPSRLLRGGGCTMTDAEDMVIMETHDWGRTWTLNRRLQSPRQAVGWRGVQPTRIYLASDRAIFTGPGKLTRDLGSILERSDDDGQTWQQILSTVGERTEGPVVKLRGLTYDPSASDRVYILIDGRPSASADGGATWAPLGQQDLPQMTTLALGIDGRNLYAGTRDGLFRLRLG